MNHHLDNDTLPWTIDIAFYAISGAVVLEDDCEPDLTMGDKNIYYLAQHEAAALKPIQRAALQNPGKASVLAKMITCTQALWFCSQCIARLSQNMAISLIELNTFAHCIGAFFIYAFWWHKQYDAEAHVQLHQPRLLQDYLLSKIEEETYLLEDGSSWGNLFNELIISEIIDQQVSIVAKSHNFKVYHEGTRQNIGLNHKTKCGALIPETGFALSVTDGRIPVDLAISYYGLECWKRLWHLRCNTRLKRNAASRLSIVRRRAKNLDEGLKDSALGYTGKTVTLILISVFLVYGGIHLLAWQYNFQTDAERIMWRVASITTASSGLIILLLQILRYLQEPLTASSELWISIFGMVLLFLTFLLVCLEILARSFLIIESFRALPNSPSSVYEIPRWTVYLPHI